MKRITLLSVLGYEALGCLVGGILLVAKPDGSLMKMPVEIMHGAFTDFLFPGVLLFLLGVVNLIAFFSVLRKSVWDWLMAALALGGLAIWFWTEIAILLQLHWLHVMWGLPVLAGGIAAILLFTTHEERRRAALFCGIFASLLYVVINIIVAIQWKNYDAAAQTVSELSAIDAPTRMLWTVLSTPYTYLMIAFGWGVRVTAKENRRLRIAGGFLLAYAVLGMLWPLAPMHMRHILAAGGSTFSDTLHLGLGAATEIIYLFALGFAASALGKAFRIYSIITVLALLVFGVLTFIQAPHVALNESTPFIGICERINIAVFLLWVIILALVLLKPSHIAIKNER